MRWRLRAWTVGALIMLAGMALSCGPETPLDQPDAGQGESPGTETRSLSCYPVGAHFECVWLADPEPEPEP